MKFQLLAITLLSLGGADAFSSAPKPEVSSRPASSLSAQKNHWMGPVAATAMGWALASQIAVAGMLPADQQQQQPITTTLLSSSSNMVAIENLDYSLPSYEGIGANTGGFGQGSEARLGQSDSMENPGANEKAKQAEAMRKAEVARLERKEADKLAKIQRNEDIIQQAEIKKKADAKKVAALFGI